MIAFSGFILATQAPFTKTHASYHGEILENYTPEPDLRIQQSHIRGIRHDDMAEIPRIKPIPEAEYISSYYGMRIHPVHKVRMMHTGVDFPGRIGSPVVATAGGLVTEAVTQADSSTYGKHVIIGHDDVYWTLYAHLSKVLVKEGQVVEIGDTIGLLGNTGISTNPHLHYEVLGKHKRRLNPAKFF